MDQRHAIFLKEAGTFIPHDRLLTDPLRRFAWGTDAGFYRLTPQIVILARDEQEVSRILGLASRLKVPVTFRAAGTSLSGQSVSDSVLVVAGKGWEAFSPGPDADTVTLGPGIVGARVGELLKPYGRRFGPDPASIGSCMVGGIVMNNASGMSCGTHANSDVLMVGARMVFADGTVLDTEDEASRESFRKTRPDILDAVLRIRARILEDESLAERIKYKYSIKNVTGLNLLPFVRFSDPFEIVAHLLAGSEGTLAFMGSVTMRTLPEEPYKADAMVYFPSIRKASEAVVAMKAALGLEVVSAAELLDRRSLQSVGDPVLGENPGTDVTAVLTRTAAFSEAALKENISRIEAVLGGCDTLGEVRFTTDPSESSRFWALRSGIFPSVGGLRRQGTTCLIEDVAFHIEDLPDAVEDLSALLDRHGYDDSCIYGHALEGNFHFIINQSFDSPEEVARHGAMIDDVARMVVGRYDGSLKAEHGTGRNMAPYVEYEWGHKAFGIMKEVKAAFDPEGILNPGVIFNDDPACHLRDFKALPLLPYGAGLDKCIECGFCEVNCVSCGFTLSPRTRIAARREIARLEALKEPSTEEIRTLKTLRKEYSYLGDETCAGDGLCSMSCPMGINVADLTHAVRAEKNRPGTIAFGGLTFASRHFPQVKSALRGALRLASFGEAVMGDAAMEGLCRILHKGVGLPLWTSSTPRAYKVPRSIPASPAAVSAPVSASAPPEAVQPHTVAPPQAPEQSPGAAQTHAATSAPQGTPAAAARDVGGILKVVYFPSCINQMMGLPRHGSPVDKPLVEEMVSLLEKAGCEVIFPKGMDSLCCGTIWESKGMEEEADRKAAELEAALLEASRGGEYPVLCDQSPCLHRMRKKMRSLQLYEPAEFILTFLLDRLEFHRSDIPVAVHLTCSMRLMKLDRAMLELAALCSSDVLVPEGVGCCGFAGDKGMTTPELNAYALRNLRGQVRGRVPVGYSNSRTCEIGLSAASGVPYVSIAYLVDKCTTAKAR